MASVSAASSVPFKPLIISNTQAIGKVSNLRMNSVGWGKNIFPSLRTFRLNVSCSAKPETVEKVCDIVKKQLVLPEESKLTAESKFSDLGADSLDTVEIVMSLEEAFGIGVEEENSQNITTVQEAADLIDQLLEKKKA